MSMRRPGESQLIGRTAVPCYRQSRRRIYLEHPPVARCAPLADTDRMARMTPSEANAVNVVASYLSSTDKLPGEVARALEVLASRAHNRIQTGWDEDAVRRQWPAAFNASETDL